MLHWTHVHVQGGGHSDTHADVLEHERQIRWELSFLVEAIGKKSSFGGSFLPVEQSRWNYCSSLLN